MKKSKLYFFGTIIAGLCLTSFIFHDASHVLDHSQLISAQCEDSSQSSGDKRSETEDPCLLCTLFQTTPFSESDSNSFALITTQTSFAAISEASLKVSSFDIAHALRGPPALLLI